MELKVEHFEIEKYLESFTILEGVEVKVRGNRLHYMQNLYCFIIY